MQSQGLVLFLFIFIVFPLIILSSNHNAFFIVLSLIILFLSVTNIISAFFKLKDEISAEDQEMLEEMQETSNMDIKRFGLGTTIVKEMICLLFLIYCAFSISALWLKLILAAVMAFYFFSIYVNIRNRNNEEKQFIPSKWLHIPIDIATILIIISVAIIKYQII